MLGGMHRIHIRDQRVFTNKSLGHGNSIVNGMGIREDGICGYSFISMWDIEGWESDLKCFLIENLVDVSPLSGVLKGFLDSFSIDPTKIMF